MAALPERLPTCETLEQHQNSAYTVIIAFRFGIEILALFNWSTTSALHIYLRVLVSTEFLLSWKHTPKNKPTPRFPQFDWARPSRQIQKQDFVAKCIYLCTISQGLCCRSCIHGNKSREFGLGVWNNMVSEILNPRFLSLAFLLSIFAVFSGSK